MNLCRNIKNPDDENSSDMFSVMDDEEALIKGDDALHWKGTSRILMLFMQETMKKVTC